MIHSIKANKTSFKTINFKEGFNVVLADRKKEATNRDSRNGLGKSTMIEIIHFCLGGNKGETLKKKQLEDWTFTIKLDLGGKTYSVSRNTNEQNKVIVEGDCSDWPIEPTIENAKQIITKSDWIRILGKFMFDLQLLYDYKYHPTFRSLISYFVRKNGQSGAFLNPFQQYKNQLEWDIQVNNSYLLGLGWEYAAQLQILKDKEKVIEQIKQEARAGLISNMMGNIGELEARKIRLESQANQEKGNLDSFRVHEQYQQIEEDANTITRLIHEKINQNIDNKRLLEHYQSSLEEELDAKPDMVTKIYREAGLLFPEKLIKRIDEVLEFHKKIVINRKEFLTLEINRLKQQIIDSEKDVQNQTLKRAELMQTLQTHGALEELTYLQRNHQNTISELKDTAQKLENLKKFEEGKSAIIIERELLHQKANTDLNERTVQKESAILAFNLFSEKLYKAPGTLSINIPKTGYKFDVDIQRSGSHGIGNMKIFCYDLMLAHLWSKRMESSLFLIHDSIIFADVDERQKALALQLAQSESRTDGFQYICTMNSDTVPRNEFENFDFDKYVVATFTDATEDGGLLGIRF